MNTSNRINVTADLKILLTGVVLLSGCSELNGEITSTIEASFLVSRIEPEYATPGEKITFIGSGLNSDIRIGIDGRLLDGVHVISMEEITLVLPEDAVGLRKLTVSKGKETSEVSYLILPRDLPLVPDGREDQVCAGQDFFNLAGDKKSGTRKCETYGSAMPSLPASDVAAPAEPVQSPASIPSCDETVSVDCIASNDFPAISRNRIDATKMLESLSLLGITGKIKDNGNWDVTKTFSGAGFYSGITNYPDPAKMLSSVTVAGVPGQIEERGVWNLNLGFPGPGFYSGVTNVPSGSDIRLNHSVVGVLGSYGGGGLPPCIADGQTGCVAGSYFPAADTSNRAVPANIRKGIVIGGISGTFVGGGAYISLSKPGSYNDAVPSGGKLNITFSAYDPLTIGQQVSLYYKKNDSRGCSGDPADNEWSEITSSLNESDTSYLWEVSLPMGYYYVCARFSAFTTQYTVSASPVAVDIPGSCKTANGINWRNANGGCSFFTGSKFYTYSRSDKIKRSHSAAIAYCTELVEGGFSDWRLPTFDELHGAAYSDARYTLQTNPGERHQNSLSAFPTILDPPSYGNNQVGNYLVVCVRT